MKPETRDLLKKVSTATLYTALFKRGLRNQMIQDVRPLNPNAPTMVGEAFTLRYMPAREDRNGIAVFQNRDHPQRKAVEECPPGAVMVIDSRKDARAASAGGILGLYPPTEQKSRMDFAEWRKACGCRQLSVQQILGDTMKYLVHTAAAALLACNISAHAQGMYPSQPVKWIVPYAPGGTTDVIARNLATQMGQDLGQPVVVDNKPGAATIIGATQIARSAPDGYTVGTADSGTLAFNPVMYKTLTYNVDKDFTLIGGLGKMPMVLAVTPSFPAKNVQEFLALVRKSPGTISFATPGIGSPQHVALELFKQRTGTDLLHVPYNGSAPALQDLMAGHVQTMFTDLPPSLSMIKSGKVRVLAVATPKRLPLLPDVPTLAEAGVKDFEAYAWQGFIGPAKLPEGVVSKLNKDLVAAIRHPEMRAKLEELGIEPMPMTPAEFSGFVRSEQNLWSGVIKAANIQLSQ